MQIKKHKEIADVQFWSGGLKRTWNCTIIYPYEYCLNESLILLNVHLILKTILGQ